MSRRVSNRKLCDMCSYRNATHLLKQPSKGTLVLEICVICWEKWARLHYDTITVTDDDVIGIDDGKPVFRDGLFPTKKVLIRYKLKRFGEIT